MYTEEASILYIDGTHVYEQNSKILGSNHDYTKHQENEFAKDTTIQGKAACHTKTIGGRWRMLKSWIQNHGGVKSKHLS